MSEIRFEYDFDTHGVSLRVEFLDYVPEALLERLKLTVAWVEQTVANLPDDESAA
jgi:hypothetical protein